MAGGRALTLSVRELGLLVELARADGHVARREDLYARVWGALLRPGDRSIDVYVRKLRVKLERALPEWRFIHTHVGFGYRLRVPSVHTLFTTAPPTGNRLRRHAAAICRHMSANQENS